MLSNKAHETSVSWNYTLLGFTPEMFWVINLAQNYTKNCRELHINIFGNVISNDFVTKSIRGKMKLICFFSDEQYSKMMGSTLAQALQRFRHCCPKLLILLEHPECDLCELQGSVPPNAGVLFRIQGLASWRQKKSAPANRSLPSTVGLSFQSVELLGFIAKYARFTAEVVDIHYQGVTHLTESVLGGSS